MSVVTVVLSNAVNSSQFLSRKALSDCFTDWHSILNEDVHVTLCLEQKHAGYYGVNPTLDGNPSDIGAFNCSCSYLRLYLAGNHLGKLFTTILLLEPIL